MNIEPGTIPSQVTRVVLALAAILALGSSACVREKNVRIEAGPPGPWREQRLLQPREPLAHLTVSLRQASSSLEASVERHARCYAIDVREVPRARVSEQLTAAGTYVVAAAMAVTGAVVIATAESGKQGVVPAGLAVIAGAGAVLGGAALRRGRRARCWPRIRSIACVHP